MVTDSLVHTTGLIHCLRRCRLLQHVL